MVRGDWQIETEPYYVPKPFADRLLGAYAARAIHEISGLSFQESIYVSTTLFVGLFFFSLSLILLKLKIKISLAIPLLLSPFFYLPLHYIGVFDSISLFLSTIFIIYALSNRASPVYSFILSFFTLLARFSNFILVAIVSLKSLTSKRWLNFLFLIASVAIAALIIRYLQPDETGNIHKANPLLYYFAKIAVNFIDNYMGIRLTPTTQEYPCSTTLGPYALPFTFGNIDAITVCFTYKTFNTIAFLALTFGAPGIAIIWMLARARKRDFSDFLKRNRLEIYSLLALWLAAPTLGFTVSRLFIYAAPFLILLTVRILSSPEFSSWLNAGTQREQRLVLIANGTAIFCFTAYLFLPH